MQKSVRLVVNYLRTQKAVVRVSPDAPLRSILPLICAKCEVSPEHVVLLREAAGEELELSKSLSELGIKELYAWDNRRGEALRRAVMCPPPPRWTQVPHTRVCATLRTTEVPPWPFCGYWPRD